MECPRCRAELPEVAHFCQTCGLDLQTSDQSRRRSFAARPDEPVASFALISTIMPRGSGQRPQTYRIALTVALTVALVAAIFGALPIAVLVAAFAVPIVYIVYLYDVNLWEDEPIPVTGAAFALTGVLALVFTLIWTQFSNPGLHVADLNGATESGPRIGTFLLVAVLVPVIGEAIRQIGPCFLASRPRFDDLMDGLTFGVISGVAYATFDTLVRHSDKLFGGLVGTSDPGFWVSLIFLEGLVKPLIMGTATGIACAEFSGLGKGYDGFSLRYVRGLAEAVLANIAFAAGSYLFSFLTPTMGVLLTIIWGLLILGVLILRVRNVLHKGLMEAALERTARDRGVGETGDLEFCAHCEMPLLGGAAFCNACGTAVRARAKRPGSRTPAPVGAAAAGRAGQPDPAPDQFFDQEAGPEPAEPAPLDAAGPVADGPRDALSPTTQEPAREAYPARPERSQPTPTSHDQARRGPQPEAGPETGPEPPGDPAGGWAGDEPRSDR